MNQTAKIQQHLVSGKPLTGIDALSKFGCFRLAARIYDLKNRGLKIKSRKIERQGKRYSEYYFENK